MDQANYDPKFLTEELVKQDEVCLQITSGPKPSSLTKILILSQQKTATPPKTNSHPI